MTDHLEFLHASPVLMTRDLSRTADYYMQHLGFSISALLSEYLILRRGAVWLHFVQSADLDPKENVCRAVIYIRGAARLYEECKAEGILRHNAWLHDREDGLREFSLIDPDGNLLTFGEAIGAKNE